MSNPHELNPRLTAEIASLDRLRLSRTIELRERFKKAPNFFTYDLSEGDFIEVFLDSTTPEGVQIEEDRSLFGRMTHQQSGLVTVLADSHRETSWTGKSINFGTTIVAGGIIASGGLLRGIIVPGSNITVDLGGKHFINEGAEVAILPSVYSRLAVNGFPFFDLRSESGQA